MEILSVQLTNFKAHSDRRVQFQPGTNAICGENGAGKTSILEAIAWVLFNYRGAYKTEDLIRNGANSAQAMVELVSARDGRTYRISRCTRAGYSLYDPQLSVKLEYTKIEEEVAPWLRQHLGVPMGTDLAKLFANTIGVPQGTFTADFLQTTERRKPIFDAILKVEEYRQANQQLLSLEKFAKAEAEGLERTIATYSEQLEDFDELTRRRQQLTQDLLAVSADLGQWQQQLAQIQTERDRLLAQASQIQQLNQALSSLTVQISAQQQAGERLAAEVAQAQRAAAICTEQRPAYEAVQQAQQQLQTLEQRRLQRAQLQQQRQNSWEHLSQRQVAMAGLVQQLEQIEQQRQALDQLAPQIAQQQMLEAQQQDLTRQLQDLNSQRQILSNQQERLNQLRQRFVQLRQTIGELEAAVSEAVQLPQLEQQQQRLQQQSSRVAAAQQFQAELEQIVSRGESAQAQQIQQWQQILAQIPESSLPESEIPASQIPASGIQQQLKACLEDNCYEQLLEDLRGILDDLAEQASTESLQQQMQAVEQLIAQARQQQARGFQLDAVRQEQARLEVEGQTLKAAIQGLELQLATQPDLHHQSQTLAQQLVDLGNPIAQAKVLEQQLQQGSSLLAQSEQAQTQIHAAETAIAELDAQLAEFADLDVEIAAQQQRLQQSQPGYQRYLEHQQLANCLKLRSQELDDATQQVTALQQQQQTLQMQQQQLGDYDPAQSQAVQVAYDQASGLVSQLGGRLPEMQKRTADLDAQLTKLQGVQEKVAMAQQEIKARSKADRFIKFARKAYKDAGPRITERYVQNISREADRLFRELLNRPNVSLEWTRDYEIIVREAAYERRMVNLSGGEQMCAALAVRLALLKTLADIDVAFFDEPTTNMDRPRREHLAEAIANIRSFKQLFVISHDDTFEKVTENVIVIDREEGFVRS